LRSTEKLLKAALRAAFTAITDQTNHKKSIESFASQSSQYFSWFGFERKTL